MWRGDTQSSRSARACASWTSGAGDGWASSPISTWTDSTMRLTVPVRAVSDEQRVLAAGEEIGDEIIDRTDRRFEHLLHATRYLAVHGVEHLTLAGVDHGNDHAIGVAVGEGEQIERRDADHRDAQRQGERLAGGEPDAHPGEQPRTDVDGDHAQLGELDVSLVAHELDRRGQDLGVAAAADHLEPGDHTFVAADRDADLLRWRSRCRGSARRHRAAREPLPTRRPRGTRRRDSRMSRCSTSSRSVSRRTSRCSHEQRLGDIAPFDEHDPPFSASSSRLRSATSLS